LRRVCIMSGIGTLGSAYLDSFSGVFTFGAVIIGLLCCLLVLLFFCFWLCFAPDSFASGAVCVMAGQQGQCGCFRRCWFHV